MPMPLGFKMNEATRIKLGNSHRGKKHTEETKRKIGLALTGRIVKRESIEKMKVTKRSNPNRFGKFSANWKGGKTRLTQLIRSSFNYRQWRSDVFQRDNYCCTTCGKKSNGDIEVHHIKSLAKIISERDIKNIIDANNCEELWNINNGQTLCIDCHKKTDTYCNVKNGKT